MKGWGRGSWSSTQCYSQSRYDQIYMQYCYRYNNCSISSNLKETFHKHEDTKTKAFKDKCRWCL